MNTRAITQIPATFFHQSRPSDSYQAGAIALQAPGDSIVASTRREAQTPGVGVALHPLSDSPVALRFRGGSADSAALILTPGQVFRVGDFRSFEWGLPFGWLGGGTVLLYVLHTPEAQVDFAGVQGGPVIFHRVAAVISAAIPVGATPNWPGTFPWPSAAKTDSPTMDQAGSPIVPLSVESVLCRLCVTPAAPVVLSLVWRSTEAFGEDTSGGVVNTDRLTYDLTFPAVPAGLAAYPVAWIPPEIHRLTGGISNLSVIDPTGALAGECVQLVRYCRF